MSAIAVHDLCKTFGGAVALENISFRVKPGEMLVIVGASGSGKSTLLRCLNGLEIFNAGRVEIGDTVLDPRAPQFRHAVHRARQHVGIVFQSFNLFGHLTALDNVALALKVVRKMESAAAREVAQAYLTKVALGERAGAYPWQLSGGQQQRAAIARALALGPRVMLYDEPTSALDPSLVREVTTIMQTLRREGMTQVLVTHEMKFARNTADHILMLHQGRVIADLPAPEFFENTSNPFIRAFLDHM